jgi:hypothetical protein
MPDCVEVDLCSSDRNVEAEQKAKNNRATHIGESGDAWASNNAGLAALVLGGSGPWALDSLLFGNTHNPSRLGVGSA